MCLGTAQRSTVQDMMSAMGITLLLSAIITMLADGAAMLFPGVKTAAMMVCA